MAHQKLKSGMHLGLMLNLLLMVIYGQAILEAGRKKAFLNAELSINRNEIE